MSSVQGQILAYLKKLVNDAGLTYSSYNMNGNHLAVLVLDRHRQRFVCLEVDGDSLNLRICPPEYHCETHSLADPGAIDRVMAQVIELEKFSGALSAPEIEPITD